MRRVVVTGIGAITPVGNSALTTWEAFVGGRSGIGPITTFDTAAFDVRIAGDAPSTGSNADALDPDLPANVAGYFYAGKPVQGLVYQCVIVNRPPLSGTTDENGRFIEGYYIVGLLAVAMLRLHPGAAILHDPRLVWNTREMVLAAGGEPVLTRTGHAFIKENMRVHDAVYGGEMSAHHFFREFSYCDSGMIPWLLVLEQMGRTGKPLSALVGERIRRFPASGEKTPGRGS